MSDLETFAQSRVGSTLRGKYCLEKLLGVGGMAAVYQATHRVGNRVAVKVLHPHMSINADVRARFLREGYVANRVDHRGAVRVLDDDTAEDGSVFLAMELLQGETLEGYWRRHDERLPAGEVAELAHQLLDVLAAAHEKGIVHRDIKPENLFLTDGGTLKVLDFGIARLANAAAPQGATRTGRMLGSPAFMAPEQALGLQRNIDGQTDLWSAGATMFTLVSGQYVHDAETVEMLLVRAGSQHARSLATVAPEVPAPIVHVVDNALAFEKAGRWGSARAMQTALEAAYFEAFGKPIPGARSTPGVSRPVLQLRPTLDDDRASFAPRPLMPGTTEGTQYQPPVPQAVAVTHDDTGTEIMPRPAAPLAGASTTAGIEARDPAPVPLPPGARRTRAIAAAIVGALAFFILAGVLFVRNGDTETPRAAASGPVPAFSAVPSSAPKAASAVPIPSGSGSAAPPVIAFSALPESLPQRPTGQTTHGAALPPVRPAPVPIPPPTTSAKPNPDCNPSYTVDPISGWRVPKPQCYGQ